MSVDRRVRRDARVARVVIRALLALTFVVGVLAVVAAPSAPPAGAATRTYGSEPIDDILYWANRYATCGGLTGNKLAALMVVPTITESGAATTPTQAPSPMTLSRWDTQSSLWAFGNPSTPYQRAFWHPGVGMWQFDSAGGWTLSAATAINSFTSAEQAAKVMSSRYCASTSTTDLARIRYAWGPWYACASTNETTCLGIYNEIYDGRDIWVNRAYGVHRLGGAEEHQCVIAGVGVVTCTRIDPAKAEGNRSFASTSTAIPTPITSAFYSWVSGGREYRTWLAQDSGYNATITASKPLTANARTSLLWQLDGPGLCDATAGIGACSGWSSWTTLSSSSIAPPAVARNADGRLETVFVGGDGFVWHAWQTTPNGTWSAPARLANNLGTIAAVELARDNQGYLYAFARDTNWGVWSVRQGANDWGQWNVMGGGVGVLFDAATNTDGRLELFGLDAAGAVIHQFQWPGGAWSAWERLGGPGVYAGAAGVNPDGRMELFGVDRSGTLVHSWQSPASGNGWSGWAAFPGSFVGVPSVVTRSDGLLEVFARGADNGLWDLSQSRTSWSGWTSPNRLGSDQLSSDPAGARNRDGRLEVFAGVVGRGTGNVWQTSANGAWSSWGTLPGANPVSVTATTNADGRLLLISRQASGALLISTQMS